MKHIFIQNPAAGKGDSYVDIAAAVKRNRGIDSEIYTTAGPKDATRYIREYCTEHSDEKVRFYACGGDGTANEVANGIVGFENASMTIYPCGSGNDFVKYYGGRDVFMDIDNLIDGEEVEIDLLRVDDLYSLNIINFGFDTAVAKTMQDVKHKKIIGGKNAYTTGIIKALLTALSNKCRVWVDGEPMQPIKDKLGNIVNALKMTLCTVANGQYVGGSFHCSPFSLNNDGLLDVCLVKPVWLGEFIRFVGEYKNGTHLDNPDFKKIGYYKRGKLVHVEAEKGFAFSLDGEIVYRDTFDIEVMHKAIRFCIPKIAIDNKPGVLVSSNA